MCSLLPFMDAILDKRGRIQTLIQVVSRRGTINVRRATTGRCVLEVTRKPSCKMLITAFQSGKVTISPTTSGLNSSVNFCYFRATLFSPIQFNVSLNRGKFITGIFDDDGY